jgi:thioredoxin 1
MAPVVVEIASENRNTFAVGKLNREENPETAGKFGIRHQPIYIIFKDGEEVDRFAGEKPKAVFVQNVLNAIN